METHTVIENQSLGMTVYSKNPKSTTFTSLHGLNRSSLYVKLKSGSCQINKWSISKGTPPSIPSLEFSEVNSSLSELVSHIDHLMSIIDIDFEKKSLKQMKEEYGKQHSYRKEYIQRFYKDIERTRGKKGYKDWSKEGKAELYLSHKGLFKYVGVDDDIILKIHSIKKGYEDVSIRLEGKRNHTKLIREQFLCGAFDYIKLLFTHKYIAVFTAGVSKKEDMTDEEVRESRYYLYDQLEMPNDSVCAGDMEKDDDAEKDICSEYDYE